MTNPSTKEASDINVLIRQAELMQTKMKLGIQFKKNMEYFKEKLPDIYREYHNFEPKSQKLFIDNNGFVNLLNIASQTAAYPGDPKEFAENQIKNYLKDPTRFTLAFQAMPEWNEKHLHLKSSNGALEQYRKLDLEERQLNKKLVTFMVVVGCGLGYQVSTLAENLDIQHIFIYDENKDSFFASLHTTDWVHIIESLKNKGGSLKIIVGQNHFNALSAMRLIPADIGLFNIIQSFALVHTNSKENLAFMEGYRKEFHLNATGIGFFDDEHISFAHTVANAKKNIPVFKPNKKKSNKLPPVMVIGNGPSLDMLEQFIKDNAEYCIIVSCGTSISSLYKLGIKPDLHVEMERGLTTAQWITMGTDIEYTKSIPLLALNTVAPKVTELFSHCYQAFKPNDIGASLIQQEGLVDNYFELPACNPTATNCALSYVIHMGFSEIYLIGTDYGMKSANQHHSKNSIYHHIDENIRKNKDYDKNQGKDYTYSKNQYPRPGNFGGEVMTLNSLDLSRKNIEILLAKNLQVSCINPNDGAFIQGAKPIRHTQITIEKNEIIKPKIINKLLETHFNKEKLYKLTEKSIENKYLKNLLKYESSLILPKSCPDIETLHSELKRVFKNLKKLEKIDNISSLLLIGSIQIHFALLYMNALKAIDNNRFQQVYAVGEKYYNELIHNIIKLIKEEPFRLDDSVRTFN